MSTNKWTNEQLDAIEKNGSNILVAAAAGSGKTAVLVERIIQKIIKEGIDIDKLLVVTFTNAAASEMRERILDAIYKKIEEEPENTNLQKQIILLNKSNICTIHSFCLDVIKNNFFELDISSNFRIGAEEEIVILKDETLEELFEELYESENNEFLKLIDIYTGYKGDEPLKELILKIYKFVQSSPFPEEWLHENVQKFNLENKLEEDFSSTIWGEILLNDLKDETIDCINGLKTIRNKLIKFDELDKYTKTIESDIEVLDNFSKCLNNWDLAFEESKEIKFKTWPTDKKLITDLVTDSKKSRDIIKDKFKTAYNKILLYNSKDANSDIYAMYDCLKIIEKLILEFSNRYQAKKREKNIIDFNDIEHFALKILVKKDENGEFVATDVAKTYREKFVEIAIDEYQDSNLVQEKILTIISRGNNVYMVGDVKQSIYKFRQASPELFLKKYEDYAINTSNDSGLKIKLFKNFRSRKNVLDLTNIVFENIMSKLLGDIDYNEEEYLNEGNPYKNPDIENVNLLNKAELCIINTEEEETEELDDEDESVLEDFKQNNNMKMENTELEANFVANKIEELLNGNNYVFDKKLGYRKLTYKDIVILLRSTSSSAPIYEKVIANKGFPVFSDSSAEYLDSIEIQTIMSLLKIIDNPMQDIPLVTVLRSYIGGFTDNEIVTIRLIDRQTGFYETLLKAKEELKDELKDKVNNFLNRLNNWRKESEYLSLDELIWKIYLDTGYFYYVSLMPNGALRQGNLKMLFERAKSYEKTSFKGLYNFIRFIDNLKKGNTDLSSAKIIGENENVIRIMSIHKSKGLEFPVVFLCNTNKKFNLRDLNDSILLHQNIGLGPKYINYERSISYSTAAKEAIKVKAKEEVLSEEMRVLYVALTRAREKLIITGISKNYEKELEKKKELLDVYEKDNNKINHLLVKKYKSYLDWIELVILNNKDNIKDLIDIYCYNKSDVLNTEIKTKEDMNELDYNEYKDEFESINKLLNWKYKYSFSIKIPSKSTVTKVKQFEEEEKIEDLSNLNNNEKQLISTVPKFLNNDKNVITSAKKRNINAFSITKNGLKTRV